MNRYIFKKPKQIVLIILFTLLSSASIAGIPLLIKYAIGGIQTSNDTVLLLAMIFFPGVVISILLFEYLNKITHAALYQQVMIELRNDIIKKTYELSYTQFYQHSSDYYLNLLTEDTKLLYKDYYDSFIGFLISLLSLIVYGIYMFFLNWILAIVIFVAGLISWIVPKISGRKLALYRKNQSQSHSSYLKKIKDLMNGFTLNTERTQKALTAEHRLANVDLESNVYTYQKYRAFVEIFGALSLYIVNITAFVAGILLIRNNLLNLGAFIALMAFVDIIAIPIRDIIFQFIGIRSAREIKSKMASYLDNRTEKYPVIKEFNKIIELKNIKFERDGFKLFFDSIVFEKGKKYAIIGASGSGKTTLLQILLRRLMNHQGSVWVDGKDATSSDVSFIMSDISQHPFIFNASAMDNITLFSSYDHPNLHDFINKIQAECIMKSDLGEYGSKISGGEKKKIEILRALSRGAEVLIADEIYSGLDEKSQKDIRDFLIQEKTLTLIVVTHDLSHEHLGEYDQVIDISDLSSKQY